MRLYPVIMCGGAGTRLWPASVEARPKQFIPLVGPLSTFQETALRVSGIGETGELVIIGGARHADLMEAQLAAIGLNATLLLEPEGRDSAAAIAAAAAWIAERDPAGVAVVSASDHHVPDAAAFQAAARTAATAALEGRIVTLGVVPDTASSAYGYIKPGSALDEVFAVDAFVEKPDAVRARAYLDAGYLWNSGNFVATAETLLAAFDAHCPEVINGVRAALVKARRGAGRVHLGREFSCVRKVSFDYAVMEKTDRAAVLPVAFAWSDLGAWSAIRAVSPIDDAGNALSGPVVALDAEGCLIRSDGPRVAIIGVRDLAVIVENGEVLVCALAADQSVKSALERLPGKGQSPALGPDDLALAAEQALQRIDSWLRTAALPLWWSLGADHEHGGFHESLTPAGRPTGAPRRARAATRQAYVYARAGHLGWSGPWRTALTHGLDGLGQHYRREDGLYRRLVSARGAPLDDAAMLYDQAFMLLALAAAAQVSPDAPAMVAQARALRDGLSAFRWPAGGFRETGEQPFQSNCHMHLFEACLSWIEIDLAEPGPWRALAREMAELATTRFIDPKGGFLREFFDGEWAPAAGPEGRRCSPGHQFEWAWLLSRWQGLGGEVEPSVIDGLYRAGRAGVDQQGVAVNEVSDDLQVIDGDARLWPQAEYLRCAAMMWRRRGGDAFARDVIDAAAALSRYLDVPISGLWRDLRRADGAFVDEASPATSLYHLMGLMRAT